MKKYGLFATILCIMALIIFVSAYFGIAYLMLEIISLCVLVYVLTKYVDYKE